MWVWYLRKKRLAMYTSKSPICPRNKYGYCRKSVLLMLYSVLVLGLIPRLHM